MRRGLSGNVRQYIRDGQKIKRRETPVVPSMRPGLLPPCIEPTDPEAADHALERAAQERLKGKLSDWLGLCRILSQPESEVISTLEGGSLGTAERIIASEEQSGAVWPKPLPEVSGYDA